jgi:mycofactocin system creatininase family protein
MTARDPDKRQLGPRGWREVAAQAPRALLVPVGSCEQHGPHLPLDTDTRIAVAVAARAAATRDDVVVAPPVAYGSSGEHQGFAGTLSIGTDALRTLLVELGRSAFPDPSATTTFRSLVFVNGHGGNHVALTEAVDLLVGEGRPITAWWPRIPGGDAHAGRTETSLLLAIASETVGSERPVGPTEPIADLLPALRAGGVAAISPDGVLGDASGASAAEGEALLGQLVADLGAVIAGS